MSLTTRTPDPASKGDPLLGVLVDGRYRIDRLLGRGGVGVVYLADDTRDGGEVVIKILAPNWVGNPEILARFDREVERLSGLQHPNIVDLYDYGRHDGRAYMVMEYIEGELLKSYIARKRRLTLAEFVPIAGQILKGIGYAHSRGLMHRDLNPANIMLCLREGRTNYVKILDFGLAKLKEGEVKVTEQHDLVGTAGFLAPEQIKGEEVDLRVDVYSIGVMFYNMLSGRMPFEGEHNATLLYKHVHEPPLPLAEILPVQHDVPVHLMRLIHDCLEKDPDQRPEDANEMVEDLIDCVPAALFRLPLAADSDLELPKGESSGSTMVGLGLGGLATHSSLEPEPPGHWPAIDPERLGGATTQGSSGTGRKSRPRPILVATEEDDDDEDAETAAETAVGGSHQPSDITAALGDLNALESSMPTLRESTTGLLDQGLEASTSALGSRAYVPHVAAAPSPAVSAAPRRGNGLLMVGAVLALLAGGAIAFAYLWNPAAEPAPVVKQTMDEAAIRAALDRAEAAVEAEDFRAATRELDATKAFVAEHPAEQARAERISERVVIGQLITTARKLERDGSGGAAIAAYRDVLTRDPTDAEAREALARLTADDTSTDTELVGSVVITSNPTADLTIDGVSYGKTPYSGQLPVGAHILRMEARGYEPWESSVTIKAEKNDPFRVSMRPRGSRGRASKGEGDEPDKKPDKKSETEPEGPKAGGEEPAPKGGDDVFMKGPKETEPNKKGIFMPVGGK